MAATIALSNQKGGVGKTTSAYVLASVFKSKGYRVLAVGLGSPGDLRFRLGV